MSHSYYDRDKHHEIQFNLLNSIVVYIYYLLNLLNNYFHCHSLLSYMEGNYLDNNSYGRLLPHKKIVGGTDEGGTKFDCESGKFQ